MRERRKKGVVVGILVLSLMFSTIHINMIVEASDSVTMDQVEMNKTIPTLKSGTKAMAYVDFDYEDGISSTHWKNDNDCYFDLAQNGDDKLTLEEIQQLGNAYTIIFRAKLSSYTARDRALFSIMPNGTEAPTISSVENNKWCESLAVGVLGGENDGNSHKMYYGLRKLSATTDEDETTYLFEYPLSSTTTYDVTRAAHVSGDGDYHTIALVQTGKGFNYYVDGNLLDFVATGSLTGYDSLGAFFQQYTDSDSFHAWIGSFYPGHGGRINGNFDWFAFYPDALTTKQVQELSNPYEPVVEYYDDISTYRSETGYTYETKEGYTFAGWYADVNCTEPLTEEKANSATSAYAKYVSDDILRIKGQIS